MTDPILMGIVNVNADSFSTGRSSDPLAAAFDLVESGATIIDLGAQSASPSTPVLTAEREQALLVPLVQELSNSGVCVSVDTYKPDVAVAVLAAGAQIVNDYSGASDGRMVEVLLDSDARLVLTHNIGRVKQRLTEPDLYRDVVAEVGDWFEQKLAEFAARGLEDDRVILDPGIDLSKTPAQTVRVLRGLPMLRRRFSNQLLVALSRKDFIGTIHPVPPHRRDPGTLAALTALDGVGDVIARLHAVDEARQFLDVLAHLRGERILPEEAELAPSLYRSTSE